MQDIEVLNLTHEIGLEFNSTFLIGTHNQTLSQFIGGKFFDIDDKIIKTQLMTDTKFSKRDLLGTTSLKLDDLLRLTEKDKAKSILELPRWKLFNGSVGVSSRMCFPQSYDLYQAKEYSEKEQFIEQLINQQVANEESLQPLDIKISEDILKKIERLEVTENLKKLIREKYYRCPNHPDLKAIKIIDKNSSAVLYELFSVIFREKPRYEIGPKTPQNAHQPAFLAKVLFFNEVIGFGEGLSKQKAKNMASQNALEIFAPSLAKKLAYQLSSSDDHLLVQNQKEGPLHFPSIDGALELDLPLPEKIPDIDYFNEKKTNFENNNSKQTETAFPDEFSLILENEEKSFLIQEYHKKSQSIDTIIEEKESKNSKPVKNDQTLAKNISTTPTIQHQTHKLEYHIKKGMILEFPTNRSGDSKQNMRAEAVKFLITDIEAFNREYQYIKFHPKYSCDIKILEKFCANNIFTKLYMVHTLIEKGKKDSLDIKSSYFNGEYYIYMYSHEIGEYFCYRSEHFVLGFEMVKYFLIFTLYKNSDGIKEILQMMNKKFDKELTERLATKSSLDLSLKKSKESNDGDQTKRETNVKENLCKVDIREKKESLLKDPRKSIPTKKISKENNQKSQIIVNKTYNPIKTVQIESVKDDFLASIENDINDLSPGIKNNKSKINENVSVNKFACDKIDIAWIADDIDKLFSHQNKKTTFFDEDDNEIQIL